MGTAGDVRELLKERPDLEPAIESVLESDQPFEFDDIDVDSGAFGELVARGIVVESDEGYRVSDRSGVRHGLSDSDVDETGEFVLSSLTSLSISRLELVFLAGSIALVVVFRLIPLPTVYHEGHVVLSSNDPYYYRYIVDQLLLNPEVSPTDLGVRVSKQEPLLVVSLWLATLGLGSTRAVAGHVLAWYPIVSAAISALAVYVLAVVVTDDRRIGLASIAMLSVVPAHAFRTSLGFADHHAFDYVWLTVTMVGLAIVAREAEEIEGTWNSRALIAVLTIAVGVTGQTLAWDNSPIILSVVGGYLALEGIRSVNSGAKPRRTIAPVLAGVGIGAVVTWVAHLSFGWHTTLVASAPTMLTLGGIGVLAGAELINRLDVKPIGSAGFNIAPVALAALEVLGLILGMLALRSLRPEYWSRLTTSIGERLLAQRGIAEVQGLFSDAGGWLLLLGFALFLGAPYLIWASAKAVKDARWLPPVIYAWYFLLLSVIQVRFVGGLAPILALFSGFGLVHLAERIDIARRPLPFTNHKPPDLRFPDRRQFVSLTLLFLLVGSLGIVQVPVKTSQVTVPPAQSETAFWMAKYSDKHDIDYSDNYVFSEWGWNRMYNYFVSGESESYAYAEANFQSFVRSTDPLSWYDRLGRFRRIGAFVVTTPDVVGQPQQLGTRLHEQNGAGSDTVPALTHYRLVHVAGDGAYKVFTVVPGAVIQGTAAPNETITARTTVTVQDVTFTYASTTTANANGRYEVRVSQPGTYDVANETARVNASSVRSGYRIEAG